MSCCGRPACRASCRRKTKFPLANTGRRTSAVSKRLIATGFRIATAGACKPSRASITTSRCPKARGRCCRNAIRPGASGDISLKKDETANEFIAWSHPTLGPYNPSTLVYGDYYYTLHDRGFFTCHDAKSGKEIYGRQRITAEATGFTASPWAYNGKIFALNEDGTTYVIQGGHEFKVVGQNALNEFTLASPAIANGSLFIRTATKLYRIARQPIRN